MVKQIDIKTILNISILCLIFVAPLSTALTNLFVGITILLWIIEGEFYKKIKKLKTLDKPILFFILIYVLEVISLLWSDSIYSGGYWSGYYNNAIDYLFRHEFFYVIVAIIIYTSFDKKWTQKAIDTFIYSMLFSEIVSYGIIFGLWTTSRGTVINPSPFINHSAYSALLALTVFLLIERGIETKIFIKRVIYFLFSFTATLNLLLNIGRTGQLIFLVLSVIYVIYKFRLKLKTIFILFFVMVSLIIANYSFNKTFKTRVDSAYKDIKLMTMKKYDTSWGSRYLSILLSKKCLENNPILGYGFADAKKEVMAGLKDYDKKSAKFYKRYLNPDMNNQYLQFFNEIGFVGIFLLLAVFYFYFKTNFDKKIKLFAYLFMIDYILMFFTGCFLRFEATFILFILFMSIFVINKEEVKNKY